MKHLRIWALALVFIFMFCSTCFAETNVIQFLDTYWVMKSEICEELGVELEFPCIPYTVEKIDTEKMDDFKVTQDAGIIYINPDDLVVNQVFFDFYTFDSSEATALRDVAEVISIICALEYDVSSILMDAVFEEKRVFHNDEVYAEAIGIYEDIMIPAFSENIEVLENGEKVVLYEGKYRYTAWGISQFSNSDTIHVMAEIIK